MNVRRVVLPIIGFVLLAGCESVPQGSVADGTAAGVRTKSGSRPAPGAITGIGIEDLFVRNGEGAVLLVDVRPTVFHVMGSIKGSISVPKRELKDDFSRFKPQLDEAVAAGKAIVVFCDSIRCGDADATARVLSQHGYAVTVYEGGYAEWRSAGLE